MFKKITATISALALSMAALVFMPATAANAAITVDMTGKTLFFDQAAQTVNTYSSGQSGGFANDITVYRNAASAAVTGSVGIDAVITVDRSLVKTGTGTGGYIYVLDAASSAVGAPPAGSTSPTAAQLLQTDVTPAAANGYITLKFQFYEAGTYTGYGTGNLLTLTNVSVNSYDLDYVSGKQFTQFKGFQSYTYSSNTTLVTSNAAGGWVQFTDNTGATNYADGTGSYTKGRVMVKYDQLTELSIRHGVNASTGGKFALDFGPGYAWKDGSVQTTSNYSNPNNNPPTSANNSIYYSANTPWIFNFDNFVYADPENNAFTSVKIVTLPASGSLQLLVGSTWTNVAANAVIPVSALSLGQLRYSGTIDSSFTFKVNDGTSDSTSAYTMSLVAASTAQTVNFANPGTKQVSATAFASGATATSGLTVTLVSLTPGTCSVSGLNITALANGFCTIVATQAGNATYSEAPAVTQTFTISSLTAQTITLANPSTQTVNSTLTIAPSASSGLAVTVISLTSSVCTISGNVVTHIATGTCQLYATQAGNGTYGPASPVTVTYLVNTGSLMVQTLTFAQPANQTLASNTVTVSATSSANLAVTFTSSTTSVCTVSGTTVSFVTAGLCTITANQAGNSTFASASLSRSFYILTVTTSSLANGEVGTAYSQTVAEFGGSTGTDLWSVSPALPNGLSLNTATGVISGTPTAAQAAASYTFTVVNGGITATKSLSITISAAPVQSLSAQTITFNALPNVSLSNGAITLGATASSGLPVSYTSNTPSVCTVSNGVITLITEGYCEIEADQAGNSTYSAAAPETQGFYIYKITNLTITTGSVGSPYTQQLNLAGQQGSGTWSATNLPNGFTIDPSTGILSGNPNVTLMQQILVTYTQGSATFTAPYLLTINAAGAPPSVSKPKPTITPVNGSGQLNTPVTLTPKVTPVFPYNPGLCLIDPVSKGCKPVVFIKGQGTWTLNENGSVTFTPLEGWSGTSTIVLHAWDSDGQTDDEPLSVTIARGAGTARPPVSISIPGFAPGSPVLTTSIKNAIKAFLNKYSDYKKVQCTGVTMGPTVLKVDYALSMSRASNSCAFAVSYMRKLVQLPNTNLQETALGANIRRVIITLTD